MAAESVVGAAVVTGVANGAGVAMAGLLLTTDQSLAMGAIGGCCMFLAASASIPWSSKISTPSVRSYSVTCRGSF